MNPIFINDVFQIHSERHRILYVSTQSNCLYSISLNDKTPLPHRWQMTEIEKLHSKGKLVIVADDETQSRHSARESDSAIAKARWARIKDLVSGNPLAVLEKANRAATLRVHGELIGVSAKTLLADLRLWWTGGQTQSALLGDYYRCGRVNEGTANTLVYEKVGAKTNQLVFFAPAGQKARGRKPVVGDYEPMVIPTALRKEIIKVASAYYLKDESRSVRATSDYVISQLFSLKDENGNALRGEDGLSAVLKPLGQRPTHEQIRYMLRKSLSDAERFRKRINKSDYDNNHAASHGSVLDDTIGAGDVYEIDATFIDLWVVSADNRAVIIGKATLYLVFDRYTRLIVGLYISLENPSWTEAKQAILTIGSDWEATCSRLKVPYRPQDWPAQGVMPNRFFGDRGEMLSNASNILCEGLQISVTNPPSKASQQKCIVEGGFFTTQVPLRDAAPGYEFPRNAKRRRGKHYDRDACLTLDELTAIYLRIVIAHNNKAAHGYPLSPEDVFSGFKATPVALWNRSIAERMGAPARYRHSHLKKMLMPTGLATVRVDGIHFKGCVYHFNNGTCADWQTRASLRGSFDVQVRFNPVLVDEVTIYDLGSSTTEYTGLLTSDSKIFAGSSFAEVAAYKQVKKKLDFQTGEENTALRVGTSQEIRTIGDVAYREMREMTKGMQLGTRHTAGQEYRKMETKERRLATHGGEGIGSIGTSLSGVVSIALPSNVVPMRAPASRDTALFGGKDGSLKETLDPNALKADGDKLKAPLSEDASLLDELLSLIDAGQK